MEFVLGLTHSRVGLKDYKIVFCLNVYADSGVIPVWRWLLTAEVGRQRNQRCF